MKTARFFLGIIAAAVFSTQARAGHQSAPTPAAAPAPAVPPKTSDKTPAKPRCKMDSLDRMKNNTHAGGVHFDTPAQVCAPWCAAEIVNFINNDTEESAASDANSTQNLTDGFKNALTVGGQIDIIEGVCRKFDAIDAGMKDVDAAAAAVYNTAVGDLHLGKMNGDQYVPDDKAALSADQIASLLHILATQGTKGQRASGGHPAIAAAPAVPGDFVAGFYKAYLHLGDVLNTQKTQAPVAVSLSYQCTTTVDPLSESGVLDAAKTISDPDNGALRYYDPAVAAKAANYLKQVDAIVDQVNGLVSKDGAGIQAMQDQKTQDALKSQIAAAATLDLDKFFDNQKKNNPDADIPGEKAALQEMLKTGVVTATGDKDKPYQYSYQLDGKNVPLDTLLNPNDPATIAAVSHAVAKDFVKSQVADDLMGGNTVKANVTAATSAIIGPPKPATVPAPAPPTKPTPTPAPTPTPRASGVLTLRPDGPDDKSASSPSQTKTPKQETASAPVVTTTKSPDAPAFKSPSLTDRVFKPSTWFKSDAQLIAQQQKRAINEDAAKRSAERQKILEDERNKIAAIKASGAPDASAQITAAKTAAQQQLAQNAADQSKVNEQVGETTQAQLDNYYKSRIPSALSAIQSRYAAAPYVVQRNLKQGGPQTVSRRDELAREAGVDPKLVTNSVIAGYFRKLQSDSGIAAIQGKLNLANPSAHNVENRYVHDDFVQYLKTTLGGRN